MISASNFDGGKRYLYTPLFEGIGTQMNLEKMEIAASASNYQFDSPA